MSTFKVPIEICRELDSMVRKFWCGVKSGENRFLALKAWKDTCLPKQICGLGFKLFQEMNMALLAKLGQLQKG